MRRYAEGTSVSVEQSMAEIRGVIARYGATAFASMEGTGSDGRYQAAIQFVLGGLPYSFTVEKPTVDEFDEEYRARYRSGMVRPDNVDHRPKIEAEWRRRWRARLLWLKATLEFATGEGGDEVQRVLLPYLLLPDRRTTLYEQARRELPAAYAEGRPPLLMLTGGER